VIAEGSGLGHVPVALEAAAEVAHVVPGPGGIEGSGLSQGQGAGGGRSVDLPGLSPSGGE
jgi:hypothetical protein